MDQFLSERFKKYDKWLKEEKISYSSKVIPLMESLEIVQWILPSEQVLNLLKNANLIAINDCVCRKHYQRCDNPVEVCMLLNEYGEIYIKNGLARKITYDEAVSVIKVANDRGLVHLSLFRPDHKLYALCSCCPCCCHDLQLLLTHQQIQLVARSDYIPIINHIECTCCEICIERCFFEARYLENEKVNLNINRCYGCGLCATVCPSKSIKMELKKK